MIDNRITPQAMCAACGHIFPTDKSATEEVTCPVCDTKSKPKGIMQPSGFPSLETFEKNWKKSKAVEAADSKTLAKRSQGS